MSKVFEKAKRFIANCRGQHAERAKRCAREVEKFIRSTSGHRPGDIHVQRRHPLPSEQRSVGEAVRSQAQDHTVGATPPTSPTRPAHAR